MVCLFEFFFLAAVAISGYAAVEDFRHERIPNKALLALLAMGLAYQLLAVSNFAGAAITFFYAFFVAVLLWFIGIWPAGDAKLFSILFLFLPPQLYSAQSIVFDFLVNTFVPVFFFMFFVIIARSKFSLLKEAVKYALDPYRLIMLGAILLGFIWFVMGAMQLLFSPFSAWFDYFLTLVLLFAVFEFFRRVLSEKLELFFFGCAVLRVLLDYSTIYSVSFIQEFSSMIFVFLFFRFFVLFLAFKLYTYSVPIEELKAGMVAGELIVRKGERFEKVSLLNPSLISFMSQRLERVVHNTNFLTEKDVKRIQKLRAQKKIPFASMLVCKVQPFAVFILLGFALTVLAEGSFLVLVGRALKGF